MFWLSRIPRGPIQKVGQMVSVNVRFLGEGSWRAMTLPVSTQAAQTLAAAAKQLQLGDVVRISPAASGRAIDLKV